MCYNKPMAMSWAFKKQILFSFFIFLVAAVVFAFALIFLDSSSCSDGKKNQDEEGIDCGGQCEPCMGEMKNIVVYWSKVFKLKDGKYDAAALVENPNLLSGIPSLKYKFNIYDEKNILVAVKSGEFFMGPGEKFLILESNLDISGRIPKYAFLEFEENLEWKRIEEEKPRLVVARKQFLNEEPYPRLVAEISNQSPFDADNAEVAAVLLDKNKNAIAVSVTRIGLIKGDISREIVFTWPEIFGEEPDQIEIFTRLNPKK